MNLDKHIWEGWTVQDFIDELESQLDLVQAGKSIQHKLNSKQELKDWCKDNQPYYKKYIPEVVMYFCSRYDIKA